MPQQTFLEIKLLAAACMLVKHAYGYDLSESLYLCSRGSSDGYRSLYLYSFTSNVMFAYSTVPLVNSFLLRNKKRIEERNNN